MLIIRLINRIISPLGIRLVRNPAVKDAGLIYGVKMEVSRKLFWTLMYMRTRKLNGFIAEFGVGAGTGLAFWMNLKKHHSDSVRVLAIDSFEGFPKGTRFKDAEWCVGTDFKKNYRKYTIEHTKDFLINAGFSHDELNEIIFVPGFIPTSLEQITDVNIRLANLDLDLYQSTLDALNFVWDRMVSGGIIMFDEYDSVADIEKWPGSKAAIDEFCTNNQLALQRCFNGRTYLVK